VSKIGKKKTRIMRKKVVIGLSGGVDSAVSALLLKKQGYDVIALFMKNFEDTDGTCPAQQDLDDVALTCKTLKIPFYTVNFVKEYREHVFNEFLADCQKGLTPNPDILCNKQIKFHYFYEKAMELGADYIATGHYCQTEKINSTFLLKKGADPNKDQSYFLYAINPDTLRNVLFPIGHLTKPEVRQIAQENDIPVFNKKDSTGICFIGKRNFKQFVSQYIGFTPGDILTVDGKKVGKHDGLAYHTLGQRKGLGVGGEGDAWYVVDKNIEKNEVIIGQGKNHPALFKKILRANDLNWFKEPSFFPFLCRAKVRYRQIDQPCEIVSIHNGEVIVNFKEPQRAITPGQSIVFYQGEICLGGGKIQS